MIPPQTDWTAVLESPFLHEVFQYDVMEESQQFEQCFAMLNAEQSYAFHAIFNATIAHQGKVFFLEGAAGAGKTFVYKTLCHAIHSHTLPVLCVASSRIAALLLLNGRTAHSSLKIPIHLLNNSMCCITKNCALAQLL